MSQSRIRIAFFGTQLYPLALGKLTGFGGAETEMWSVAKEIGKDDAFEVLALTLSDDEVKRPLRFENVELRPIQKTGKLSYSDSWLSRRLKIGAYYYRLLSNLVSSRPDIYLTKLASIEAFIVWLASRISFKKFAFRIEHDWETDLATLQKNIFNGSMASAKLFTTALKNSDLVVTQTRAQQKALLHNFGINSMIIPNGHSIPLLTFDQQAVANREGVLWVARVHPMKRANVYLDYAKCNPDTKFTFIMAPSDQYESLFNQLKASAEHLPNVTFIPGVAPAETARFYLKARVFMLTSEAEGFSNVVIEALKHGTPVVSLLHNPNEILNKQNELNFPSAGYCTADDSEFTRLIVNKLAHDDDFWLQCSAAARKLAEENFDIRKVAETYKQQIRRLVAHHA